MATTILLIHMCYAAFLCYLARRRQALLLVSALVRRSRLARCKAGTLPASRHTRSSHRGWRLLKATITFPLCSQWFRSVIGKSSIPAPFLLRSCARRHRIMQGCGALLEGSAPGPPFLCQLPSGRVWDKRCAGGTLENDKGLPWLHGLSSPFTACVGHSFVAFQSSAGRAC